MEGEGGEGGGNNNVSLSYKFYFLTISLAPLSNGFRTETLRKVNRIYTLSSTRLNVVCYSKKKLGWNYDWISE